MTVKDGLGRRMFLFWMLASGDISTVDLAVSAAYAYYTGKESSGGWLQPEI